MPRAGTFLTESPPQQGQAVGARIARLDGAPKVSGTERFGADAIPADALWVRAIRSPHHRAGFTLRRPRSLCSPRIRASSGC